MPLKRIVQIVSPNGLIDSVVCQVDMKTYFLVLVTVMCIVSSCGRKEEEQKPEYYIAVEDFKDKALPFEEMGIEVKALLLDPEIAIDCGVAMTVGGRAQDFYIYSDCTKRLTIVDRTTGEVKMNKNMHGRGPGELLSVYKMWVHEDTVMIHDGRGDKILKYDLDLNFLEDITVPVTTWDNFVNVDGGMLVYDFFRREDHPYRFYYTDDRLNVIEPLYETASTEGGSVIIGHPTSVSESGDVLFAANFSNDIYVWEGQPRLKYRLDFGDKNIPEFMIDQVSSLDPQYVFRGNFFDFDDNFVFMFEASGNTETRPGIFEKDLYAGIYDKRDGGLKVNKIATEPDAFPFWPMLQNGGELLGMWYAKDLPPYVDIINRGEFDPSAAGEEQCAVIFYTLK